MSGGQANSLLTVSVDRELVGAAHPRPGSHVLGRDPRSCVPLKFGWVSRVQLSIVAGDLGWVVTNGYRTRLAATSPLIDAVVMPGGSVWVGPGDVMQLTWPELPHELVVTIELPRPSLHVPHDKQAAGSASGRVGTLVVPVGTQSAPVPRRTEGYLVRRLSDQVMRRRMAVLFRHLLLDEERPKNLYRTAAEALGYNAADQKELAKGVNLLKQAVDRLIRQLNRDRSVGLSGVDALGHFLVFTSGALNPDDLERSAGAGA